jgi:hypothetical protein
MTHNGFDHSAFIYRSLQNGGSQMQWHNWSVPLIIHLYILETKLLQYTKVGTVRYAVNYAFRCVVSQPLFRVPLYGTAYYTLHNHSRKVTQQGSAIQQCYLAANTMTIWTIMPRNRPLKVLRRTPNTVMNIIIMCRLRYSYKDGVHA